MSSVVPIYPNVLSPLLARLPPSRSWHLARYIHCHSSPGIVPHIPDLSECHPPPSCTSTQVLTSQYIQLTPPSDVASCVILQLSHISNYPHSLDAHLLPPPSPGASMSDHRRVHGPAGSQICTAAAALQRGFLLHHHHLRHLPYTRHQGTGNDKAGHQWR